MEAVEHIIEKKDFVFNHEPIYYQITCHIEGMKSYFHPEYEGRIMTEQHVVADTKAIVDTFYFLIANDWQIKDYLEHRWLCPLEFRCAQIIQHYGAEYITRYLNLIYKSEISNVG